MFLENRNTPRWMIFMMDIVLASASIGFAYLLRFSFSIPPSYFEQLPLVMLVVLSVRSLSFILSRVYSGIIRYTGTQDLVRIFLVNFAGSLVFAITNLLLNNVWGLPHLIPFNIVIIDFFILTLAMTTYRMLIKVAFLELNNPSRERSSVVIFGAGDTGLMAKRAIERDSSQKMKVIAFFDDNPSKVRKKLDNAIIYPFHRLEEVLTSNPVDQLVLAVPTIKPQRKSEIVEVCLRCNVRVLSVPPVSVWIDGNLSARQLQKVRFEDLLGRDEIVINTGKISSDLKGKHIMVTGAAGSIGSELVRQIVKFNPASVILLDQAETPLYEVLLELQGMDMDCNIHSHLCDITRESVMREVFEKRKPNIVFHAAAYKHVPMMEHNPREAIATNVMGTQVMADLAAQFHVERFIMVSTDKAVNPTSVMGASKRMAEIYTQTLNSHTETQFITTRFGNVLGSNGSVLNLFRKQIEEGGPVTVTHPKVTRYFMTIPEAARLVLEAASMGNGGEIFLFNMGERLSIKEVAEKMIKLSGFSPGTDIQIVYTGLRPGEKLFEELLSDEENTIHTGNPHILAALVREYAYEEVSLMMQQLQEMAQQSNPSEAVKLLKKFIPEYISKNSVFEQLD